MDIYPKKILTVSAGCGQGKTYATCKAIAASRIFRRQLYVAPTTKLLEQTQAALAADSVPLTRLDSTTVGDGTVVSAIVEYLKTCEDHSVLLITWNAYAKLPYFHKRDAWDIYIDEVPQLDTYFSPRLPYNYSLITDHVEIHPVNSHVAQVKAKDARDLRRFMKTKAFRDDGYRCVTDLLEHVASNNYDVFVDIKSWDRVFEGGVPSKRDRHNRVHFVSMLRPTLFKGATLIGANIEQSLAYLWMTRFHGCDVRENEGIAKKLRKYAPSGASLRVSYFFEGKSWSKTLRNKKLKSGRLVRDVFDKYIQRIWKDEEFLLIANKDYQGVLDGLQGVLRVPVDNKGLNKYQSYTKVAYLPALNRSPEHLRMMNRLGLNSEEIRTATSYENLYQTVMRSALRNAANQLDVEVLVPTEFEADFLIMQFGEGHKKHVLDSEFRAFRPLTQIEKNRRAAFKKVRNAIFSVYDLARNGYQSPIELKGFGNDFLPDDGPTRNETGCYVSFHKQPNDYGRNQFVQVKANHLELKKIMRSSARCVVDKKDDCFLVNPSVYTNAAEGAGHRRLENFLMTSFVVLDFDGGTLTPQKLMDVLWKKACPHQKRSFMIMNTFSTSPDDPNRYRVFIPLLRAATTVQEYEAVHDAIVQQITDAGYDRESTGLDRCSRSPVQSYWMPCTNRAHPESAFFHAYGYSSENLNRYAINPRDYARTAPQLSTRTVVQPVGSSKGVSAKSPSELVESIKNRYRTVPKGEKKRNDAFFKAARALNRIVSIGETRKHLEDLAAGDQKMTRRISEVIESLRGESIGAHLRL